MSAAPLHHRRRAVPAGEAGGDSKQGENGCKPAPSRTLLQELRSHSHVAVVWACYALLFLAYLSPNFVKLYSYSGHEQPHSSSNLTPAEAHPMQRDAVVSVKTPAEPQRVSVDSTPPQRTATAAPHRVLSEKASDVHTDRPTTGPPAPAATACDEKKIQEWLQRQVHDSLAVAPSTSGTFEGAGPRPFTYFLHIPRTGGRALQACFLKSVEKGLHLRGCESQLVGRAFFAKLPEENLERSGRGHQSTQPMQAQGTNDFSDATDPFDLLDDARSETSQGRGQDFKDTTSPFDILGDSGATNAKMGGVVSATQGKPSMLPKLQCDIHDRMHDDYSLTHSILSHFEASGDPRKVVVATNLRDVVDRMISCYEFSVSAAAGVLWQKKVDVRSLPRETQWALRITTSSWSVWPWNLIVPRMAEAIEQKMNKFGQESYTSCTGAPEELELVKNPYESPLYPTLNEWLSDPVVQDVIINGHAMAILGVTSYVDDDRHVRRAIRECTSTQSQTCVVQQALVELAKQRVDQMLFVGFTEEHEDIAERAAASFGLGTQWERPGGLRESYEKCIAGTHGVKKKQESEAVPGLGCAKFGRNQRHLVGDKVRSEMKRLNWFDDIIIAYAKTQQKLSG